MGKNVTCPDDSLANPTQEKYSNGFSFHQLLMMVAAALTVFTCLVSFSLILKHATHYSVPKEQKQIIRVIFVLPAFAVISLIGVTFESASIYVVPLSMVYEGFGFVAFFMLLCEYLSPDKHERDAFFQQNTKLKMGFWIRARFAVFQIPLGMILVFAITDITEAAKRYCEVSDSPHFGHIWTTIISTISTGMAMAAVISFYKTTKSIIGPRKPLLKLISFKLVVGLTWLQSIVFSELTSHKVLKPTKHATYNDLTRGIPNTITCLLMAILSVFFLYSFRTQEYYFRPGVQGNKVLGLGSGGYQGGTMGLRAIMQAMDIRDIFGAMFLAISQKFGGGRGGGRRMAGRGDDFIALTSRHSQDHQADHQYQPQMPQEHLGNYQQPNYQQQNYQQQNSQQYYEPQNYQQQQNLQPQKQYQQVLGPRY